MIPPIYRRFTDEILVELHLLSHQKNFRVEGIFSVGLTKVFEEFTQGYKPEGHLNQLFEALCLSSGYDSKKIRELSAKTIEESKSISTEDIFHYLQQDQAPTSSQGIVNKIAKLKEDSSHYSRIITIGLKSVIISTGSKENIDNNVIDLAELIGFSRARVEKDLALYNSSKEKLNQAFELLKDTLNKSK